MNVFISYRREDTGPIAQLIYSRLAMQIGENRVFLDTDTLAPGDKFSSQTARQIGDSEVFLLLIGPDWENSIKSRHLEKQPDFVLEEISEADRHNIPIVPIWIDRESRAIKKSFLPEQLQFICELNARELRAANAKSDFDEMSRALSSKFPRVFGSSRAPILIAEQTANLLHEIPYFSDGPIRPFTESDKWESCGTFIFDGHRSDSFRFSVFNGSNTAGICFFSGADDATEVAICGLNKKTEGIMRLPGIRSQYGFYWPVSYFSVFGEYGAKDYYYSPSSTNPWVMLTKALFDWVLLNDNSNKTSPQKEVTGSPKGCARRSQSSRDTLVFSTVEPEQIEYYSSFNGLYSNRKSTQNARGTIVQFSQTGSYTDFSFVLKDAYQNRTKYRSGFDYFGSIADTEILVTPIKVGDREELFTHPSGNPILIRGHDKQLVFEIYERNQPKNLVESVSFNLANDKSWPVFSFSRDGRHVAITQPYDYKIVIVDLFTGSVVGIIHEHGEPSFSPDGEHLAAIKIGRNRKVSIFSKSGLNKQELGSVDYNQSMYFPYMNNNGHHDVRPPICWADSGRSIFILHENIVTMYQLKE